jgi:hypothetical protein
MRHANDLKPTNCFWSIDKNSDNDEQSNSDRSVGSDTSREFNQDEYENDIENMKKTKDKFYTI